MLKYPLDPNPKRQMLKRKTPSVSEVPFIPPVAPKSSPTDAKSLEEALQELTRLRQQLSDRERLAGIGLLVSDVAHEIYNPLAWLQLNESLLRETLERILETKDSPPWTPDLQKLRQLVEDNLEGLKRISNVVASMRLLSRPHSELKELHDVNDVCRRTLTMLEPSFAKAQARLEADYGEVPKVRSNESDLAQAVMNLLVNAKEAVPAGGHVRLRTSANEGRVFIEVSDDGSGVPEAFREKIWEPFFTTKSLGTGLGLPMVRSVARDHGGDVELERNPAGGATFRFWILRTDGAATSHARPRRQ